MNQKILDYIKILSKSDKKNLSQKTLKAMEEIGELAKKVLPYENAFATNHRFVDREGIIEELADSLLVIYSIAYDLDATNEELEDIIKLKLNKWADLQARENRIKSKIPYEIHVTIDFSKSIEEFKKDCFELQVKPILLDLHLKSNNETIKDLMTSSVFFGTNKESYEELKRISLGLKEKGYKVLREKIETIPWHPAAPSMEHQNPIMPPNCYFESHLNIVCTNDKKELLQQITDKHQAHQSKNAFKIINDVEYTLMITYRNYKDVYEEFQKKLNSLKEDLINNNFIFEKEIIEFSIYDTKINHDSKWIES